ncbi:MAG: PEP-CTERM sorting domain-containing protein [Verrucomicrobiota bacterium]
MRLTAVLAAMSLAGGVQAQTATNVFQQTPNQLIPDANPTGYSSTNVVSGLSGGIQSVEVSLDVTGGWNGDLYAYLSFGDGFAVLLNRVGKDGANPYGYGDAGFDVTFSDSAATDIHLYGGNGGDLLTGTWQPDGRETDPFLVVSSDPRTAMLSSFDNLNPNGTWTLFVEDAATGYQSTLVSWSIEIVTVPEPATLALFGLGGAVLFAARRKSRIPKS